jgi:hypothetical protein
VATEVIIKSEEWRRCEGDRLKVTFSDLVAFEVLSIQ